MRTVLAAFFILSCTALFSSTAERLQQVKERILIVELPIQDEKYVAKLEKNGEVDELKKYHTVLNNVRSSIKVAFSKFWTLNGKIEFVNSDSLQYHIKGATHLYAVMRYGKRDKFDLGDDFETRKYSSKEIKNLVLYLTDESDEVLFFNTPPDQSLAGFIFSIHQFNFCADVMARHPELNATSVQAYSTSKEYKPEFRTKDLTLLINKADFEEKELDTVKLAKSYPYKFKIVNAQEIDKAMLEQNPNYSCMMWMLSVSSNVSYTDKDRDGNRYNDIPTSNPVVIPYVVVCVAKNGRIEAGAGPDKLEQMLRVFKKMLDKSESKSKKG